MATPSGITLALEGGAHLGSIGTPLIGMSQPGLSYFEPAFADEVAVVPALGARPPPGARGRLGLYLRLTTRALSQPERSMTPELAAQDILAGAYWLEPPEAGAELPASAR
ncbi:MAG: hypothetical protein U1E17_18415 [Geminicoccaceae bacterium]